MTSFLVECAWKGTAILAAAFAANLVLRRSSAAWRHFIWTASFGALLVLPVVLLGIPKWNPAGAPVGRVQVSSITPTVVRAAAIPKPVEPAGRPVLPFLLLAGGLAAASRFLVGAARTSRMVRGASDAAHARALLDRLAQSLGIRRPVRAIQSAAAPMPLTWGIMRPVVILPEDAPAWPAGRLNAVLLHELIHVRRLDVLAQAIGQAACSLYWFHPLAWLALAQLRKERERACDDAVLQRGVPGPEYAGHLMDLVRGLAARRAGVGEAPAMAEASGLEARVRALLDRDRNRKPLGRWAAVATVAAIVGILVPLAAITAQAQSRGTIAGVVQDPSGARVPNCRVTARNLDGANQETAIADGAGEYQFANIPSGRYALEFATPGFVLFKIEATLVAGAAARVDANLTVGSIAEVLTVRGQKSPTIAPKAAATQRIAVGGQVTSARLVRQPRPVYPAELQQLGVQGIVKIDAIIARNGTVLNPVVRNTVDPRLAQAALEAVRQWVYQPALLNGHPIETITKIDLNFQLDQ